MGDQLGVGGSERSLLESDCGYAKFCSLLVQRRLRLEVAVLAPFRVVTPLGRDEKFHASRMRCMEQLRLQTQASKARGGDEDVDSCERRGRVGASDVVWPDDCPLRSELLVGRVILG
jgi:hypothetical protein